MYCRVIACGVVLLLAQAGEGRAGDAPAAFPQAAAVDAAKAAWLVAYSRETFEGSCACPDDIGADGRQCGEQSFYAKHGTKGYLFCFASDVLPDTIKTYQTTRGEAE